MKRSTHNCCSVHSSVVPEVAQIKTIVLGVVWFKKQQHHNTWLSREYGSNYVYLFTDERPSSL
jgi:hypothetical protein